MAVPITKPYFGTSNNIIPGRLEAKLFCQLPLMGISSTITLHYEELYDLRVDFKNYFGDTYNQSFVSLGSLYLFQLRVSNPGASEFKLSCSVLKGAILCTELV